MKLLGGSSVRYTEGVKKYIAVQSLGRFGKSQGICLRQGKTR